MPRRSAALLALALLLLATSSCASPSDSLDRLSRQAASDRDRLATAVADALDAVVPGLLPRVTATPSPRPPPARTVLPTPAPRPSATPTPRPAPTITPSEPEGPIPTRLPLEKIGEALRKDGYEVRTSDDAGGYLCNHLFYELMSRLPPDKVAGFVHVPPTQGPWDLPRLEAAVRTILETLGQPATEPVTTRAGR